MSLGGLVFNIGNVGGAATGFNIVFGFPLKVGTVVAGVIGILIFLSKDAKNFMDKLTKYLGSNEISESRNNFICDILSTHTGHTDDGPDI